MSFREKTAWISLLSMAGIYGVYFWSVVTRAPVFGVLRLGLAETIVLLAAVQVVLTVAAALFSGKDAKAPRDERDRLIGLQATRVAYAGLATSVVVACYFAAFNPPILFNTNALLFVLVSAEMLRMACQVIQYRRAA
jgi:hypothetical protein